MEEGEISPTAKTHCKESGGVSDTSDTLCCKIPSFEVARRGGAESYSNPNFTTQSNRVLGDHLIPRLLLRCGPRAAPYHSEVVNPLAELLRRTAIVS